MSDEVEHELDELLGPDALVGLRAVSLRVSPDRELTLHDLVVAWSGHVVKILRDLPLPDDDRSTWGAHDLIAALALRDFVAEGVARLPGELTPAVHAALAVVDGRFTSCTEEDAAGALREVDAEVEARTGWWWRRIPVSGSIRREIDTIAG